MKNIIQATLILGYLFLIPLLVVITKVMFELKVTSDQAGVAGVGLFLACTIITICIYYMNENKTMFEK